MPSTMGAVITNANTLEKVPSAHAEGATNLWRTKRHAEILTSAGKKRTAVVSTVTTTQEATHVLADLAFLSTPMDVTVMI